LFNSILDWQVLTNNGIGYPSAATAPCEFLAAIVASEHIVGAIAVFTLQVIHAEI